MVGGARNMQKAHLKNASALRFGDHVSQHIWRVSLTGYDLYMLKHKKGIGYFKNLIITSLLMSM